jgi:hypothetical protein
MEENEAFLQQLAEIRSIIGDAGSVNRFQCWLIGNNQPFMRYYCDTQVDYNLSGPLERLAAAGYKCSWSGAGVLWIDTWLDVEV